MPDEWVHVYVCTPETMYQVLDETRPARPAKPKLSVRSAYAIALKILIFLSRLL